MSLRKRTKKYIKWDLVKIDYGYISVISKTIVLKPLKFQHDICNFLL